MQLIFTALAILAFVVLTPTIFAVNTTVWGYITLAALFGVFLSLVAVILSIFSPILSRIPVVYEICCIPFSDTCPKLSRILGTINFTLFQLIVISCCLYIRPVNSDTYRLPKIMYQTNDIVVVKNEEIKTIDYAYFEVKDKETKEPATELTAKLIQNAIQKGLLLENCGTAGNVVRFLAPLTMTDEQMEKGLEIFEDSLKEVLEA